MKLLPNNTVEIKTVYGKQLRFTLADIRSLNYSHECALLFDEHALLTLFCNYDDPNNTKQFPPFFIPGEKAPYNKFIIEESICRKLRTLIPRTRLNTNTKYAVVI